MDEQRTPNQLEYERPRSLRRDCNQTGVVGNGKEAFVETSMKVDMRFVG
jgi:hypothetical protein